MSPTMTTDNINNISTIRPTGQDTEEDILRLQEQFKNFKMTGSAKVVRVKPTPNDSISILKQPATESDKDLLSKEKVQPNVKLKVFDKAHVL